MIVRYENHMRRVLKAYAKHYNAARTHRSLETDPPVPRKRHAPGEPDSRPYLGGLHHEHARAGKSVRIGALNQGVTADPEEADDERAKSDNDIENPLR